MAGYGHNNSFAAQEGRKYTVTHDSMLMDYLHEICSGESRTAVKAYLTKGQIVVNDRLVTAYDHPLKKGDRLLILRYGKKLKKHSGEIDTRVKIVYEDDHIIVAEKRHAVLTMSTGKEGEATAYSILTDYVKRSAGRKGGRKSQEPRIFIVHRLDRDTSGLVIFAKDQKTQEMFQEDWNNNILERKYVAILEGRLPEPEGVHTSWLKENPKSLKMSSSPVDNGGKKAVTRYRHLLPALQESSTEDTESSQNDRIRQHYSLAEFELETGRKNQIRVHAAEMGCPVTGDKKYGARNNPLGRLALHARSIAFRHPWTGKVMRFDTGIPGTFKNLFSC